MMLEKQSEVHPLPFVYFATTRGTIRKGAIHLLLVRPANREGVVCKFRTKSDKGRGGFENPDNGEGVV